MVTFNRNRAEAREWDTDAFEREASPVVRKLKNATRIEDKEASAKVLATMLIDAFLDCPQNERHLVTGALQRVFHSFRVDDADTAYVYRNFLLRVPVAKPPERQAGISIDEERSNTKVRVSQAMHG